jgi:tetrahydromethanopterin:alpha-L-glutamate ligase
MKVGIVVSDRDDWTAQALMASFSRRQMDATFLDFSELKSGIGKRLDFRCGDADLLDLDALVVRDLGRRGAVDVSFRFEALTALRDLGLFVINPPEAISSAANKYATSRRLHDDSVPTPRTVATTSPKIAEEALHSFKTAVSKPLFGYKGKDIILLKSSEQADIERLRSIIEANGLVYLQEFITVASGSARDIRAFVVDGRLQGAIYRNAPPGEWISNLARGGRPTPCPRTRELEDLAVRSACTVGAIYCGVDLLESKDGLTTIEVNGTPSGKGIYEALGIDVTEAIAQHVFSNLDHRKG